MLKFAIMQLLWDFKQGDSQGSKLYTYRYDERLQLLAFSPEGQLVFHRIINLAPDDYESKIAAELGCKTAVNAAYHSQYHLTPSAFSGTFHPAQGKPENCVHCNAEIDFCYSGALPLALAHYHIAAERCRFFPNYVLCHVHQGQVTVAAFQAGQLLLLNTYPAGNEAEALYFSLAAVKKAGIEADKIRLEIMAEEHVAHIHLDLFGRFCHDTALCPLELPYADDEFPPGADISALLYRLARCV